MISGEPPAAGGDGAAAAAASSDQRPGEPRPALVAAHGEPEVLRALDRDLRRVYAGRYRILTMPNGDDALGAIREMRLRGEPIALVMAAHGISGITGLELIGRVRHLVPDARALLTVTYKDTEVAIRAIDTERIDDYVVEPWDPADERLYPILDDLLLDWASEYMPVFRGIQVIGHRWSPDSHRVRDYLSRNQVPFRWVDLESSAEAHRLLDAAGAAEDELPLVLFPGGDRLANPSLGDLAARLGLSAEAETPYYDVIIVGAGPAGLAAAVYATSEGLSTALIEREVPGGQAGQSSKIENYLGFPAGVSGGELARRALTQARRFGAELLTPHDAIRLERCGPYRVLHLADGRSLTCQAAIIASGVSYRRLPAAGADRLTGRGVYYGAAMAETVSCVDENVVTVGGGNSAGQAAMHFSRYARRVTMVVREPSLSTHMSKYLVDRITRTPAIEVRLRAEVAAVDGDDHVTSVVVRECDSGGTETLPVTAVFIFIGAEPCTDWLAGTVQREERGYILTGPDVGAPQVGTMDGSQRDRFLLETSVPGVFAAGDVRHRSMKRVASAVGEGATAISFVHQCLQR